jgi:hypothetical protein
VTLSITDGTNTVTNSCALIVVQNPDTVFAGTQTVCVSTSGNTTDCPSGALQATNTSSFTTAIGKISNSHKRLLFRAGETWTASSTSYVSTAGPGYIGSYGTGAAPIILATGNINTVQFDADDWRMMDFEINGQNTLVNGAINAGRSQITWLRLNIHNVNTGFDTTDFNPIADQFTIQDSTVYIIHNSVPTSDGSGGIGVWIFAKRFAFQGNSMDPNGGGEHVLRFPLLQKAVIAYNDLANPAPTKEFLKLHQSNPYNTAATWSGNYTEQVIIADNHSLPTTIPQIPWSFGIEPQNDSFDERLRDIIIERNWMQAGSSMQVAMQVATMGTTTIRNNIIDTTNGPWQTGIRITRYGPQPAPNDVRVYNNTIYSSNANGSSGFIGIEISSGATNSIVRNNLASAPSGSSPYVLANNGTGTTSSNNLMNTAPASVFTTGTPVNPVNFGLSATNLARDHGSVAPLAPVFSDFFLNARPLNGVPDIGAVEGP